MPFNLLRTYNQLLDLAGFNAHQRRLSLMGVFDRDFTNNTNLRYRNIQITPTPQDGEIEMATLFTHLTTVIVDKATRAREFDIHRSLRLHWVRFHIDCRKQEDVLHFSVKEPEGIRTYIYDIPEKYVVVLEPKPAQNIYFLLTAYHLQGKDSQRDKILKKYKRRLNEIF
jgi:hypothetical protein